MVLKRLDNAWILVRRAAGHDQRTGALGRIFGMTAAICADRVRVLVRGHPRARLGHHVGQREQMSERRRPGRRARAGESHC